jgi:hypothetical protein
MLARFLGEGDSSPAGENAGFGMTPRLGETQTEPYFPCTARNKKPQDLYGSGGWGLGLKAYFPVPLSPTVCGLP